jgi:hemoglobin/transferrin/lactoferrin receptor protein
MHSTRQVLPRRATSQVRSLLPTLLGLACLLTTSTALAQSPRRAPGPSTPPAASPPDAAAPAASSPDAPRASKPLPPPSPSNVPVRAPFTGPAASRPLPPPSSLATVDIPDPLAEPGAPSIEESVQQMLSEAVVSTASKRNQRLSDVPMTISWIPADELEGTGQFTLCEAIQYFPGMECRRGPMRKAAVSARGLGSNFLSNRLLLLQDGRPLTDPWTGQFYADETTPLSNLKQIEVIRGPGSSLYGSNAFSGVINIIQRQPSDLIQEGHDVGVDGRVLVGQNRTFRAQATAAGRAGPVEALLNYYGLSSDGPQIFNEPQTGQVDTNESSLVHQVSGKVNVAGVALDASFTQADIGRPGGQQLSAVGNCGRCHYTPNDMEHVQNFNASAQVDKQVTDHLRVFAQAYTFFKRRLVDLENSFVSDSPQSALGKRRRLGGEARGLLSLGAVTVTFGGDYKNDVVNNSNILPGLTTDDTRQQILGGFVDAEVRPTSRLVLGAGARYDKYLIPETVWQARTDQISPRASAVFHAREDLSLRANYGRAFRAPTLAELAINQQMYAATLIGNGALRAETLDTVEASVDFWPFNRTVRLTGTGFYNLAKNFINQELRFGSTSRFENIGDARVLGLELEAAAQVAAINSSFDVAYQLLDARSLASGSRTEQQLDYAPRHRVYARGRTNFGKVAFAELYALYVGARFDPGYLADPASGELKRVQLPGYITANARVGANVTQGLTVSLLASNLFNAKYEESHGFPAPPLSVFGEVKYQY